MGRLVQGMSVSSSQQERRRRQPSANNNQIQAGGNEAQEANDRANQNQPQQNAGRRRADVENQDNGNDFLSDFVIVDEPEWQFKSVNKPRSKYSVTGQALNGTSRIVGNTIGKAVVLPARLVGVPFMELTKHSAYKKVSKGQMHKTHDVIPGWNGTKYGSNKTSGADILADFRRVPTVWSYLTAGKASDGKDAEGNEKPKAPEISAYFDQPKSGSSRSLHYTEMGHAMLGIEYSRYSSISGRLERYKMQYGFYPAGGTITVAGSMTMLNGAILPGQLLDDKGHKYDIGRKYAATDKQVQDIVKASETYADKGYAYYSRNCTTFVRDMFNVAGIKEGGDIFKEEKIRFNSAVNVATVASKGFRAFNETDVHRQLGNMSQKQDLSYQGMGNKRVTGEDFVRFADSLKKKNSFGQKGLIPAASAENMRRLKKSKGALVSYKDAGTLKKKSKDKADDVRPDNLNVVAQAINTEGKILGDMLRALLPNMKGVPNDLIMWIGNLSYMGRPFKNLHSSAEKALEKEKQKQQQDENKKEYVPVERNYNEMLTSDQVRSAHEEVSNYIKSVSDVYGTYLKNDSRLNGQVMKLLSMMEIGREQLDRVYAAIERPASEGDLGTIRDDASLRAFEVTAGGKTAIMTPSQYEAYLQVYGTPAKAVSKYLRYEELRQKCDGDEDKLSWGRERNEYKSLNRNDKLARQFVNAHNYLLEKQAFSQKDIDYAFSLRKKETQENVSGGMYDYSMTTAGIYIAMFLEKIFGGMRMSAENQDVKTGGLPHEKSTDVMSFWLDDYLTKCVQKKPKGMEMILRGISRSHEKPTKDVLMAEIKDYLINMYLKRVFDDEDDSDKRIAYMSFYLHDVYDNVYSGRISKFPKLIEKLSENVLAEKK